MNDKEIIKVYNEILNEMKISFRKRGIPLLPHFKSRVANYALVTGASIEDCVSYLEEDFIIELGYYRGIVL